MSECIISETGIYTNCGRGSGNVHLNALKFSDKLTPENQGISTLLHETMHALALKHPFAPTLP
ncbi:hypothetical protein Q7540_12285, partial [Glaesserella parasuis]|uniref:hypothetical protein n=1 Tax=Glaesserella parasuis TaxID=738 RepID=UPI0027162F70|nr:hypothetical protein [Glaesserella parasuis]